MSTSVRTRERPPRALPLALAVASLAVASLAAACWPGVARAYDRQLGLFAGAGYTGIVGDTPYPPHAVHGSVGVGVGLSDVWELRGRVDYAFHPSALHRLGASVDLVYLVDVLSVVPYLGLSAGGLISILDASLMLESVRGDFVAGGVLGLDVLLGREWTVGVEVRPTVVITDLDREPLMITGLVRAQALFEI